MKLPRNVDAARLITALRKLGYAPTRQTGSHIRVTFDGPPAHSVTIPNHSPIKLRTPNAILGVAAAAQANDHGFNQHSASD